MLETLTTTILSLKTLIYYSFYYSFKTGQLIVNSASSLVHCVVTALKNVMELLLIVLESFSIFFQDISNGCSQILALLAQVTETTITSLTTIFVAITSAVSAIVFAITSAYNSIFNSVLDVIEGIGLIFVLFKRVLVLFGSGVWFALTIIPLSLVYFCTMFSYFLGRLFDEILHSITAVLLGVKNQLLNLFEFVTDVPVEATVGILTALCIGYIFAQFYLLILQYFREKIITTYLRVKRFGYNCTRRLRRTIADFTTVTTTRQPQPPLTLRPLTLESRRLTVRATRRLTNGVVVPQRRTQLQSRRQIRSTDEFLVAKTNASSVNDCKDEMYCVICQERVKCILVLPCRHVCMCSECNSRLQLYNNTCPICRKDIEQTMKIFV